MRSQQSAAKNDVSITDNQRHHHGKRLPVSYYQYFLTSP